MNATSTKFDLLALLEKNIAKYGGVATLDAENSIEKGKRMKVKGDKDSEDTLSKRKKCKRKADSRMKMKNVKKYRDDRSCKEQETELDNSSSSLGYECVLPETKMIDIKTKATISVCDDEDKHRMPENKPTCYARKNQECRTDLSIPQILLSEVKKEPSKVKSEHIQYEDEVNENGSLFSLIEQNRKGITDNIKGKDGFSNIEKVKPTDVKFEYTEYDNEVNDNVNSYTVVKPMRKELGANCKNEDICDKVEDKSFIMQLLRKSVSKVTNMESTANNVKNLKVNKNKIDKQMGDKKTSDKNIQMTPKLDVRGDETNNQDERTDGRRKIISRKYNSKLQFTEEEDKLILDAVKKYGDHINPSKLAKQLGRSSTSVYTRIKKLKTGERSRKQKRLFSLEEDLLILDRVLPHLHKKLLKDLQFNFTDVTIQELATLLSRDAINVNVRWASVLHSWILQYSSGTLNFDIRKMLLNHLADTFCSKDDIDWPSVASKPEFVGHTEKSLRRVFSNTVEIIKRFENTTNPINEGITLSQLANGANDYFSLKQTRVPQRILTRQAEVIDYFEQYRKKHNLTNFF